MGQDSGTIRKDIEDTRERMGETVDALAYKTDVGARAKDAVGDRVDRVKEHLGVAQDKLPDTGDVKHQGRKAKGLAQDNPLGLAIGAVAVGFVAGLLIPNTKVEDERLAPVKETLQEHVQEAAQTAAEHGKEVAGDVADAAKDAAGSVVETAKESGREHASQASDDVGAQAGEAQSDLAART